MTSTTLTKPTTSTCSAHDWCTVTDPGEHAEFHASATVDLVGAGHQAADGWWAWLVRGVDDRETSVVLEGVVAGREYEAQVPAAAASALLAATGAPQGRDALDQLLTTLGSAAGVGC